MSEAPLLNMSPVPEAGGVARSVTRDPAGKVAGSQVGDETAGFSRVLDDRVAEQDPSSRGSADPAERAATPDAAAGQPQEAGEPVDGETAAASIPESSGGTALPPEDTLSVADGKLLPLVGDATTPDPAADEHSAPVSDVEAGAAPVAAGLMPAAPAPVEPMPVARIASQQESVQGAQQGAQTIGPRLISGESLPRTAAERSGPVQIPVGEDGIDGLPGHQDGSAMARGDAVSRIPEVPVHAAARLFLDTALRGESIEGSRWAGPLQAVGQLGASQPGLGGSPLAGTTAAPLVTTLDVPFRQAGWDTVLAERLVWMTSQQLQAAEIKLNPPHLGPMEVRIQFGQDQAQIHVSSQHAVVRDAVEASVPRLREIFDGAGVQLGDVNVSQQSFAQQQQAQHPAMTATPSGHGVGEHDERGGDGTSLASTVDQLRSLLDVFA